MNRSRLSGDSLNASLQSTKIRTPNTLNLLSILHENERWHRSDTILRSHTPQLIHIDLDEPDTLVLLAQLADFRSDGTAGTTPGSVEVDNGCA